MIRYEADIKENFRMWLQEQEGLIEVAKTFGYSTGEAIELLKLWELTDINDNLDLISRN